MQGDSPCTMIQQLSRVLCVATSLPDSVFTRPAMLSKETGGQAARDRQKDKPRVVVVVAGQGAERYVTCSVHESPDSQFSDSHSTLPCSRGPARATRRRRASAAMRKHLLRASHINFLPSTPNSASTHLSEQSSSPFNWLQGRNETTGESRPTQSLSDK